MVNQNLLVYIQKALSQGNDINAIRNYLLQQGFNHFEVDEAINFQYGQGAQVQHAISLSKNVILTVLSIALALAATIYLAVFLTSEQKSTTLLDFEATPIKTVLTPGESLQFKAEIFNMGNSKRYDVTVTSTVVDDKGKQVAKKEETFALETRSSKIIELALPRSIAGAFTLKSEAKYPGGKANSTFDFSVAKEQENPKPHENPKVENCTDGIRNHGETGIDCGGPCRACSTSCESCDDNNACTKDYCKDGKCVNEAIRPCCGDGICDNECDLDCKKEDPKTDVDKASQTATTDPDKAEEICKNITDAMYKDRCFELTATISKESKRCSPISSESKKDACYMEFAMNGDYTVCDLVINPYLKKSCESLKYIKTSQ